MTLLSNRKNYVRSRTRDIGLQVRKSIDRALYTLSNWMICVLLSGTWALSAQAQPKDQLVIGFSGFPSDVNPFVNGLLSGNYLLAASRRLVTRFDGSGKMICQLCTEMPTVQNGRVKTVDLPNGDKGMEVTFTLRPGLKWGDGTALTTKDIVFGAEIARSLAPVAGVSSVVANDERSYTVKLSSLRYDFDRLSPEPVNAAIEEPIFRAAKKPLDYAANSIFSRAPGTPGLWNGPYLMTGFTPGQIATFAPNPYWDGAKPAFRQVAMRFIGNSSALQANLLSGDIDMAFGLDMPQALDLQKHYADRFDFTFSPIADELVFFI